MLLQRFKFFPFPEKKMEYKFKWFFKVRLIYPTQLKNWLAFNFD